MILVAGSANLDFVVRAPHIPAPGETVLGREFRTFPGGKGANQAVACARAGGAETAMLVALGNDAFAVPLEESLRDAGVRLHVVRAAGAPTGTAFICVSDDAQNAITVAPGANASLRPSDLPDLAGVTHLLMQLETPVECVLAYALAARAQGVKVVLNAAPARVLPSALLDAIDILVVNETELVTISACTGDTPACLARVDVPCIVVTLGPRGCCARVRDVGGGSELIRSNAFPVEAVDTTAAGDTFCGMLVAALARNEILNDALRLANAAGALACTRSGAQTSIPSHAEVRRFLQRVPVRAS